MYVAVKPSHIAGPKNCSGVSPVSGLVAYYASYAFGGPGFSVPMGLLIAGVCVPAAFLRLLPKWLVTFGLILAVCGELSWLNLIARSALP
jgi:hypothetical protein